MFTRGTDKEFFKCHGVTFNKVTDNIVKKNSASHLLKTALFLDRDGTLMEEVDHCHDPKDVRAITGAADRLAKTRASGWHHVIITNQSGIGRGYFTEKEFNAVQEELQRQLGGAIDATYMAPDNPENVRSSSTVAAKGFVAPGLEASSINDTLSSCAPLTPCPSSAAASLNTGSENVTSRRKPAPGMLLEAAKDLGIDLSHSFMIGDRASDIAAGRAAGCRTILVLTGYGKEHRDCGADFIVNDVTAALDLVLSFPSLL